MQELRFFLEPVPPFRLDLTVWALRRRPDNVVDRWDGAIYRRVLILEGVPVEASVREVRGAHAPRLEVVASGAGPLPRGVEATVAVALGRLLGTGLDLTAFYRLAALDPALDELANRFRGLKPPRYLTLFECLTNAIACQQVTLTLGIRLLNRIAEQFGRAVEGAEDRAVGFPEPEDLIPAGQEALRRLGFSYQKARAVTELASTVLSGGLSLESLGDLDDQAAIARLQQLRGVGRWTAEYALLRGLGRLHVFPGDDSGARNRLRAWLGLADPLDTPQVDRLLATWQPYAGLLYFHLLLHGLAERGHVA